MNNIFLSYTINQETPSYGNKDKFYIYKKSAIVNNDTANNSYITTSVHMGTHIDMPYHFYENAQTIKDFDANFWIFKQKEILFIEIKIKKNNYIIKNKLIKKLKKVKKKSKIRLLIIKTGMCNIRNTKEFWEKNFGFHHKIAYYLRKNFPNVNILAFDSISVSSWQNRILGRKAHKAFLNPKHPILLLEDMNLLHINKYTKIKKIIIAPILIENSDGLPCCVIGEIDV